MTPHLNRLNEQRRDGLDEGSQHMVSRRNKKKYNPMLPLIYRSWYLFIPLNTESVTLTGTFNAVRRFQCGVTALWFVQEFNKSTLKPICALCASHEIESASLSERLSRETDFFSVNTKSFLQSKNCIKMVLEST